MINYKKYEWQEPVLPSIGEQIQDVSINKMVREMIIISLSDS